MFQKKWAAVKQSNKERLAHYVEHTLGLKINTHAMFDVQVKVRFTSFFFLRGKRKGGVVGDGGLVLMRLNFGCRGCMSISVRR